MLQTGRLWKRGFCVKYTPEQIVFHLDKYIVGQENAKKAVAIALRNRYRRQQLDEPLRSEIASMHILMTGSTGSGKTEIARRLAKLTDSPFVKVEATRYTEVGVYGSNTDSMIHNLLDVGIEQERKKASKKFYNEAKEMAMEKVAKLILKEKKIEISDAVVMAMVGKLKDGEMANDVVTVPAPVNNQKKDAMNGSGVPAELSGMIDQLSMMMNMAYPKKRNGKKVVKEKVKDAIRRFVEEDVEQRLDKEDVVKNAIRAVESTGIVFVDEIDKLATDQRSNASTLKKGEGVQKELLALTDGCNISTRHGMVNTSHILFIASGAFHRCKPSDLMPELQGRLPIRVSLSPLGAKEFSKILTNSKYNLIEQSVALLRADGVKLTFTEDAIEEIAKIAEQVNAETDDIGARRLATIVSKLVEDISFRAPAADCTSVKIDRDHVRSRLHNVAANKNLSRYIL